MNKIFISKLIGIAIIACIMGSCKKDNNPFPKFPKPNGGSLGGTISLPFMDSMNYKSTVAEFGIPAGWLEGIVAGSKEDRGWAYRATYGFNGGPGIYDGCIVASSFGGNIGTDNAYLIVGPFDMQSYASILFDFELRREYSAGAPGTITFKYSTNFTGTGDPEDGVTWTNIDAINKILPLDDTQGFEHYSASAAIPHNQVYIALHAKGSTNALSPRWRFDNISIKGQ